MSTGLQDLASVMVDLSVSSSGRRHALQSTINPISKVTKRRFLKRNSKSNITAGSAVSAGLVSALKVPFNVPTVMSTEEIIPETELDSKDEESTLLDKPKHKKRKSLPAIPPIEFLRTSRIKLNRNRTLSRSDDGNLSCELQQTQPRQNRPRRILHMDISRYVPRKVSTAELKARRKMSESYKMERDRKRSESYKMERDRKRSESLRMERGSTEMDVIRSSALKRNSEQFRSMYDPKLLEQNKLASPVHINELPSPVHVIVTDAPP